MSLSLLLLLRRRRAPVELSQHAFRVAQRAATRHHPVRHYRRQRRERPQLGCEFEHVCGLPTFGARFDRAAQARGKARHRQQGC
jgi:hypothetical protein